MSNSLREGNDGAVTWAGQSGTQIIYYDIEWPWISLHCLVIMIGVVFLVLTMIRSKKVEAPMYGSSIPAIFPHGSYVDAVQAVDIKDQMFEIRQSIARGGETRRRIDPNDSSTELHDMGATNIPRVRLRDRDSFEDGLLQGLHA